MWCWYRSCGAGIGPIVLVYVLWCWYRSYGANYFHNTKNDIPGM